MPHIHLERLRSDANTPETLKNILSSFTWKRNGTGYRAKEHGSYSIYCKSGQWLFTSHNGDYKTGDALTVAADVHRLDLKTKEGLYEAAKIVCEAANLDFSKYCSDEPSDPTPSQKFTPSVVETKAFLPNAGHTPKVNFTFDIAAKDGFTYKAASKYYERKTGTKQTQNVVFLQSMTHIDTQKKTVFNHKKIGIAYLSNGLAGNIKVKVIDTETGKKQMFTIQNAGNYVFGLDSLPTDSRKDFTLLLCAGEDDTTAINTHLQPFGYCAVTFGSESAKIPSDFLTHLQTQFKAVFCLLDSDKTGVKMAIRNATANGLPHIAIADHYPPSVKDVCDIYKQFGHSELLKLVKVQTTIKTAQKAAFERVGYNLHSVLNLNINQYLSEKLPLLKNFVSIYPKILLQSPTDTGKTTAIIELSSDPQFYASLGIDSIVLTVPRLFLCDQLKAVFEQKTGVTPSVIDGKASNFDVSEAYQSKVIICTYDSLKKLESHLKDCLLVIDELHLLTDDTSFRSDVTAKVFDLMPKAKRVLGLTATPNFEMCIGAQLNEKFVPEEIKEALNFTLCKVSLTKEQTKNLQLKAYPQSRIDAITQYASQAAQGSNKAAVLLNDVKVLETVSEVINAKYDPNTATILSSQKAAYNVENPTYQAIVKGEAVPTDNRVFLGTNILTAGVSLNFAVENLAIFGNLDSRTITQFSARPRLKGDVNKNVNVDLFKRMTKTEFETVLSDFEQKNIETPESLKDSRNALEMLESAINAAVSLCETINSLPNKADKVRRKTFDELGFVFFDENTNEWKPKLTTIIYNHNQRIEKRLTMYGKVWKAQQYDQTFEICPPQWCDFDHDQQATDILSDKKETVKEQKTEAFKIFAQNKKQCLEIAYKQTSDYELKEAIKTEITPHKELSGKAKELKKSHPSVIDHLPSITGRYFDLKAASFGVSEITSNKVVSMLVNVQKESEYTLLKNRIISLSELRSLENGTLTNGERIRALNSKRIIEAIKDFKKAKRRSWLTAGELVKLVSTSKRRLELNEAKLRIAELFEVDTERKELTNGKRTVYNIGHRLTLKSVMQNATFEHQTTAENASNSGQKQGQM